MTETLYPGCPESFWRPFEIWLGAHDIDVDRLASLTIGDKTVTARLLVVDADGQLVPNNRGDACRRVLRVVPIKSPVPRRHRIAS